MSARMRRFAETTGSTGEYLRSIPLISYQHSLSALVNTANVDALPKSILLNEALKSCEKYQIDFDAINRMQPATLLQALPSMLDFLSRIVGLYTSHTETKYIAINYFCRYLACVRVNTFKHRFALVACCAILAVKVIEEVEPEINRIFSAKISPEFEKIDKDRIKVFRKKLKFFYRPYLFTSFFLCSFLNAIWWHY